MKKYGRVNRIVWLVEHAILGKNMHAWDKDDSPADKSPSNMIKTKHACTGISKRNVPCMVDMFFSRGIPMATLCLTGCRQLLGLGMTCMDNGWVKRTSH